MEPAHIVILRLGVVATRLALLVIFDGLVRRDVGLGRKAETAGHAAICGRHSVGVLGGGAVHVDRIQPSPHLMQRIISYSLGRVDDALVLMHLQLLKDFDLCPKLGQLLLIRGERPYLCCSRHQQAVAPPPVCASSRGSGRTHRLPSSALGPVVGAVRQRIPLKFSPGLDDGADHIQQRPFPHPRTPRWVAPRSSVVWCLRTSRLIRVVPYRVEFVPTWLAKRFRMRKSVVGNDDW
ncbi:hypothetical protein PG996_013759 [Apiospora saccharicola]|uniref:Secreted protein n=1 Tax=Apiospora saccharicola TaxID=335842 RepID=A0ABR1TIC1_9PEZI